MAKTNCNKRYPRRTTLTLNPHINEQTRDFIISLSPNNTIFNRLCYEFGSRDQDKSYDPDKDYTIGYCCTVSNVKILKICATGAVVFVVSIVGGMITNITAWFYVTGVAIILHSTLVVLSLGKTNYFVFKKGLTSFVVLYRAVYIGIAQIAVLIFTNWNEFDGVDIQQRIIRNVLNVLNFICSVFGIGLFDGFATESVVAKRIILLIMTLLCLWFWLSLYFRKWEKMHNEYTFNESFTTHFMNRSHSFSWKSIAMSSFFKTMTFCAIQLWLSFKRPNKFNAVAPKAEIQFRNDTIDTAQNEAHKDTEMKPIKEEQAEDSNNSNISIDVSESKDRSQDCDVEISEIQEESYLDTYEFTIKVSVYRTLFYVFLENVLKFEEEKALKWSKFWHDNCMIMLKCIYIVVVACLISHCFMYTEITRRCWVIIIFYVLVLLSIMAVCLNLNYELVYYKRRSIEVLWKQYQATTLVVAIFCIRYKHRMRQFSPHMIGTMCERISVSTLALLWTLIITWGFSMHFAYHVGKCWKLVGMLTYIIIVLYYVIYIHYMNDQLDWVFVFFGRNVSLRAIVISSGMDLCLWTARQVYHVCLHDNQIQLLSKVEIEWKDSHKSEANDSQKLRDQSTTSP